MLGWILLAVTLFFGLRLSPRTASGPQLISGYGLVVIMYILFLLLPSSIPVFWSDGLLFWAQDFSGYDNIFAGLVLVWGSFVIFMASYALFRFKTRPEIAPSPLARAPVHPAFPLFLLGFVVLGLLMKIVAVRLGGGIDQTVLRMSGGVAGNLGIDRVTSGIVVQLRSFSVVADIAAVWLLLLAMQRRKWRLVAFALFLFVEAISMGITGKRLFVLWPLLALLVAISHFLVRIGPRQIVTILAGAFLFGWATLMFRVLAPLWTAGLQQSLNLWAVPWAQGSWWRFYFGSLEFAYFDLTVAAIKGRDHIVDMFGGLLNLNYKTQIEPAFYIVPRELWSGKPDLFLDISHGLAALTFYQDVSVVGVGVASSLTGTAWISGAVAGVLLAFVFLGFVAAKMDRYYYTSPEHLRSSPERIILYAFFLMMLFHLFRQGTFGWVFMIVVIQQMGGIFSFALIWGAKRALMPRVRHAMQGSYR